MHKYKFSTLDITEWLENELEPFKIEGSVKEILEDLKEKGINPLTVNVSEDGKGYVIAENQTVRERNKYYLIEKEHETLCLINSNLHKIMAQENSLIKSGGTREYESTQNRIVKLKQSVSENWISLSEITKERFINDVESLITDFSSSLIAHIEEKHNQIFKNNGFILFDYLMINKKTESVKTDIGYYYRSMENEYLKVGETKFREWILGEYSIEIVKIKNDKSEMDNKYNLRLENFKEGLDWFKSTSFYRNKNGTKTE